MPMYEYECKDSGEVITLLRSMSDADQPVEDPKGQGREFVRRHSIFGVGGSAPVSSGGGESQPSGSCCGGMRGGCCGS